MAFPCEPLVSLDLGDFGYNTDAFGLLVFRHINQAWLKVSSLILWVVLHSVLYGLR